MEVRRTSSRPMKRRSSWEPGSAAANSGSERTLGTLPSSASQHRHSNGSGGGGGQHHMMERGGGNAAQSSLLASPDMLVHANPMRQVCWLLDWQCPAPRIGASVPGKPDSASRRNTLECMHKQRQRARHSDWQWQGSLSR